MRCERWTWPVAIQPGKEEMGMKLRCGDVRPKPTTAVNGIEINYADTGGGGQPSC
jgi:hypothetical protein